MYYIYAYTNLDSDIYILDLWDFVFHVINVMSPVPCAMSHT